MQYIAKENYLEFFKCNDFCGQHFKKDETTSYLENNVKCWFRDITNAYFKLVTTEKQIFNGVRFISICF